MNDPITPNGIERGASFFMDGDELMFQFGVDATNAIGPRKATKADREAYPAELARSLAEPEAKPKPAAKPRVVKPRAAKPKKTPEVKKNVVPDDRPAGRGPDKHPAT